MTVQGLPEHIDVTEYRHATADDYIPVRGGIQAGPSLFPTFILKPEDGFEFRYDISADSYVPAARSLPVPREAPLPESMSFQTACGLLLSGKAKKIARAAWQMTWLENHDDGTPLFVQVSSDGRTPETLSTKVWSHNQFDMRARDWKAVL